MKNIIKLLAVITALLTVLCFVGCTTPETTGSADPSQTPTEAPTEIPSEIPSEAPANRINVSEGSLLCGFENGTTSFSMFDLSAYDFMVPPTDLVTGTDAQSGNALKIIVDSTPEYGTQLLLLDPLDGGNTQGFASCSDYGYVRFWVSNVSDDEVSIAIILVNAQGKTTCLGPDGAYLIDQEGNPEDCYPTDLAGVNYTNATGDTHISIPAGFTGWAYYSIAQEDQVPWWEKTTMTADELTEVAQMRFDIRYIDATCADYLIIDEICLADAD